MTAETKAGTHGLVLQPFRAMRPSADGPNLASMLCPPYDVIDGEERSRLLAGNPDNAVRVVLPETDDGGDPYAEAAQRLTHWVSEGTYQVDEYPTLYVYEMRESSGATTRGLVGAVELRDPADGVILPHENTMSGPVADRLALMSATEADVEPIFLVYDGGGAASQIVAGAGAGAALARAVTPDGITHTLWGFTGTDVHEAVARDLRQRHALIADGHHRYATYRELQARLRAERGAGPWDYGLTLLVDSTSYGPQVHAIHRVLIGLSLEDAVARARQWGVVATEAGGAEDGLRRAEGESGFAAVLADGSRATLLTDPGRRLSGAVGEQAEPNALAELDITVLHRGLVERVWELTDSVDVVGYAHSVDEAIQLALAGNGTAVLMRPTPVAAVAAVAAAGARMPRKSTLFTPKPASGLLMRRFIDAG